MKLLKGAVEVVTTLGQISLILMTTWIYFGYTIAAVQLWNEDESPILVTAGLGSLAVLTGFGYNGVRKQLQRVSAWTRDDGNSGRHDARPTGWVPPSRLVGHVADFAATIAGPRKVGGGQEWDGDLARDFDEGVLGPAAQWRYARGLLWAAIRMRLNDLGRAAGRRLDWLLATNVRVLNTIGAVVAMAALEVARHGGIIEVIHNIQNLGVLAAGLWALAFILRPLRGVKATRRKPRKNPKNQRPE